MRKTEVNNKDDNKIDEEIEKLSFQITIYIQRAAKHEDYALQAYEDLDTKLRKDARMVQL